MHSIRILIIDDNPAEALLYGQMLKTVPDEDVEFMVTTTLDLGLEQLAGGRFDLALLGLGWRHEAAPPPLVQVRDLFPEIPVIVLGDTDDRTMALAAVRQGAQDYLVKGTVTSKSLLRAFRYAIERQRQLTILREMSLIDPLTGLYNRRGFFTLAEGHIRVAQRCRRSYVMVCADLDRLAEVNDRYGHGEGDRAIVTTAQILRGTFRQSDLMARIGGDEFVVLALDVQQEAEELLRQRLEEYTAEANARSRAAYRLSLRTWIARMEGGEAVDVGELLARADRELHRPDGSGGEARAPALVSAMNAAAPPAPPG